MHRCCVTPGIREVLLDAMAEELDSVECTSARLPRHRLRKKSEKVMHIMVSVVKKRNAYAY